MLVAMRSAIALAGVVLAGALPGCKSSSDSSPTGTVPAQRGSSSGFSASLTAEIAADTGSSAGSAAPPTPAVIANNGSGGAPPPAEPRAGSAQAAPAPPAEGVSNSPPDGEGPAIDPTGPVTNHDTSKPDTNATGPLRPPASYAHVTPPSELAAIKLDMEPNWDRDYDTAGTFSFVLRVPNTSDTRLFSFDYGYDAPGAPKDRDAYKKFLAGQHLLTVSLDRQKGAAWYLEGTDAQGQPAFRYLVVYGGKRLVCYGSLYKTHAATALGPDLRDKVVSAAKKICETISL